MTEFSAPVPASSPSPPWWTYPDRFIAFIVLPLAVSIVVIAPKVITTNQAGYDAPLFFSQSYVVLLLTGVVLLGVGAFVGRRTGPLLPEVRFRDGCLDMLFWTCMAAYVLWFGPLAISSPGLLLSALKAEPGAVYEIRERAELFSGVTTATQFGVAYCCIYTAKLFVFAERPPRRYLFFFAVIILVAGLRAVVYSERIALIEVLFPSLVMLCRGSLLNGQLPLRLFRQTLPILMIIGAPVFFTLFEYNRSWISHYQYLYDDLMQFGLERLGIYYATAINNILGFYNYIGEPLYSGEVAFRWLYRFPVIGDLLSGVVGIRFDVEYRAFLDGLGIAEFNNASGIILPYVDWGVIGGSLFLFGYGLFVGRTFNAFDQSRGFLQYFHPVVIYSLFEVLRIGYLYEGRAFAVLIGLAIAYIGWGQTTKRSPVPLPARS